MSRNFIFTWNNYNEDSEKYLRSLAGVKYCCGGYEVGDSGTPHIQGYIAFLSVKSMSSVIKLLPGCHVILAKTVEQGITYCKKDGEFFEFGTAPVSKVRKGEMEKDRWETARSLAKAGRYEEVDADIYVKYYRTLKAIAGDHPPVLEDLPEMANEWIYGPTGTGKSRSARALNPGAFIKMKNKWWDGYAGEDVVIIDDVDKSCECLGGHFKNWIDHYPFPAETKGGRTMIRPKKIIITSNYCPGDIWSDENMLNPILRRVSLKYYDKK